MAGVKLHLDDRVYEVDLMTITPREWRVIKQQCGLKAGAFMRSFSDFDEFDADAIAGLAWIARHRVNPSAQWDDELPILELMTGIELVADADDEDESDPKDERPSL